MAEPDERTLATRLAILFRGLQWTADALAFRLPQGDVSKDELVRFADELSTVADICRAHAAGMDTVTPP